MNAPDKVIQSAFLKFRRPLCLELYDLEPTENISEVALGQVSMMMCFFNLELKTRKPLPYLYACRCGDRWFTVTPQGSFKETCNLWLDAQTKATPASGYIQLRRDGQNWETETVLP